MEIGMFRLVFSEDGNLQSIIMENKTSRGKVAADVLKSPIELHSCEDENEMLEKSKIILSQWAAIVNAVELLDQNKYAIRNVPYCVDRYPNGLIREIGIHFYTEKINLDVTSK